MNLLEKIFLKIKIELNFLLIQKWGLVKSKDRHVLPKFLLRKFLPENPVIIDCGAHVGADSIELMRIFPKARIYSFEPVPELFEYLQRNTRKYTGISCYQTALGNKDGFSDFHVSSGSSDASSSLLPPAGHFAAHPDVLFSKTIKVSVANLDTWASYNNVSKIDFLWLDMQGAEWQMLKSSPRMLDSVKVIHTEVSLSETYLGAPLYNDYREWLERRGFHVFREAIPDGSDMGNVLFVRN